MRTLLGLFLFMTELSLAATVSEDFSTRNQRASGTAVWNQALGTVHPTLRVTNYTAGSPPPVLMNVGDGSDGAFVESRYAEFSKNGDISGNKIRLDLSSPRELNVTEFYLAEGWVLEPEGDNPLVIRSLSTVKILGEIWCHGGSGSASSGAFGGAGGQGRCGGADGGKGGDAGGDGDDGGDSTAPVTGGRGGNFTGGASVGGGGGGSWNTTSLAGNGQNFSGTPGDPGERGTSSSDPEFDTLAGGAGGGGGGAGTAGAGGGGGAGGGLVIIQSVGDFELGSSTNANIGYIFANGGNGADSAGNGGPGAGGGGGSVQVFSGGTIRIYNTNTGLAASQAVGGQNPAPTVGAAGGTGRSWFSSVAYSSAGFYDPSEQAPVVPGNNVVYSTAAETAISKAYDLRGTLADVLSISTSPTSADFAIEWAGSSDNFVSDDTGFTNSLAALQGKRYVKFKFTVTNSVPTAPTSLTAIDISYAPGSREDFAFKAAAGCGRVEETKNGGWWLIFLPILTLFSIRFVRLIHFRQKF